MVDLSADFRLHDVEVYKEWYGDEHKAPELQKEAVYAITEVGRSVGRSACLPACLSVCLSACLPVCLSACLRCGCANKNDGPTGALVRRACQ